MPIDKGTSKPITQLSGLQINYKDEYSCFNPPIVTTAERNALVNTDDPAKPIKDGTLVFNSNSGYEEYYSQTKGGWVQIKENAGGGDVSGPVNAINNNIAVFDGETGKKIKDGGLITTELQAAKKSKTLKATPLYKLSNLGALQFGSNENTADTGVILVDGLTPVTFQTQGTGAEARVCTVINGELGEGSSSPSALLEINSSTGGFLHARMTTAERDALLDPKDGLEIYNTDTKNLNIRQDRSWVEIKSRENVIGPSASVNDNIAVFDGTSGKVIKDSGFSSSFFRDNNFKNFLTLTNGTESEDFPVPGIDSCKVTLVGSGGSGGKCINGYKGCGGGAGAALVIYLKNLLSIPDFRIYWSTGFTSQDGSNGVDAIFEIRSNFTSQVRFTANNGIAGSDGSASAYIGGAGGTYQIKQLGSIYTADNYTTLGFNGATGGGATNSGVSGAGANSILGGAGPSVAGNNPGVSSVKNSGSGGSGASGEGLPGGKGDAGIAIIEW